MNIRERIRNGENIYALNLRVCYYARVSTEQEEQATSIVNQVDYFIRYIKDLYLYSLFLFKLPTIIRKLTLQHQKT